MGEDPGVSEIKVDTIVDVRKLQKPKGEARMAAGREVVEQVLEDVNRIICFKLQLDKHSSDRRIDNGGRSGFYKVPEDMRQRAGSKEAACLLYDPKHVNLWKLREWFGKDYRPGDVQTESQLRHYEYHLRSYAILMGRNEDIHSLIRDLYEDLEFTVSRPTVDGIHISETSSDLEFWGPHVLWGNIFLRDLFNRSFNSELSATNDQECALLWVYELWADLLLLENQIPLLMYKRFYDENIYEPLFSYFADFLPLNTYDISDLLWRYREKEYRFHHILHLIHEMLLPAYFFPLGSHHPLACFGYSNEAAPSMMKPVPTATRLQQAGIKFKPLDKAGFVVKFKRGVLMLPRLHITKCTKKVLMNLIAWEICHHKSKKYFINYAIFMDHLINTSKDVEILIQCGVFEHSLATDEEVATLFNGLISQDLVYATNEPHNERYDIFPKLTWDINKYCKSRRNIWWANLMQDYFKSPWTIISLIAALLLILLTIVQTFFSAYSYFRPTK